MRNHKLFVLLILCLLQASIFSCRDSNPEKEPPAPISKNGTVSEENATRYLDQRAKNWIENEARSNKCISCHTMMPILMSRGLFGSGRTSITDQVRQDIFDRVENFSTARPWYPAQEANSRGSELVVNAVSLTFIDLNAGQGLNLTTKKALDLMLSGQKSSGGFHWLDFQLAPFENLEAEYWGSALAAVAVGKAIGLSEEANPIQLNLLKKYIREQYSEQNLHNQLMALWASTKLSGIMTEVQKLELLKILEENQNADGGWNLRELVRKPVSNKISDSFATAYTTFILLEAGVRGPITKKSLEWLRLNQQHEDTSQVQGQSNLGSWLSTSVNHGEWSRNNMYMTDAATSYALMALKLAAKLGI